MSQSIADLDYSIQAKATAAWEEMKRSERLKALGCETVAISETKRSLAVQMAYYSCSRMAWSDVRRMYAAAGLYDIGEAESQTVKTRTLSSKHIEGKAIDFVPVKNGKYWWTAPQEVWEVMGEIGEKNGFKWGGRWKDLCDSPHFEV